MHIDIPEITDADFDALRRFCDELVRLANGTEAFVAPAIHALTVLIDLGAIEWLPEGRCTLHLLEDGGDSSHRPPEGWRAIVSREPSRDR